MSLEEVPMTAGGGAKWNASLKQGGRYPRQPPPGTVTLRNSVEILTNLYAHLDQLRGRGKLLHKGTICSSKELHDLREQACVIWSLMKPVYQIGTHDLQLLLTSIGSILT